MAMRLDIDLLIQLLIKAIGFIYFYTWHIRRSVYRYLENKDFDMISLQWCV